MGRSHRQASFLGGELSPEMWGRTDLPKYADGLRRCRNCIVTPAGAVMNRPGTRFVSEIRDSTQRVRLIPFVYSDAQSYILEVGPSYIRFYSNGGPVESTPGVRLEVAAPWLEAQLPYLKFAQIGDVMTLTHSAHSAYELKRNSHTSWSLTTLAFDPPPPTFPAMPTLKGPPNGGDSTHPVKEWAWKVTAFGRDATGLLYESAPFKVYAMRTPGKQQWSSAVTYAAGDDVSVDYSGSFYTSLQNGNLNKNPASEPLWWSGPIGTIPVPSILQGVPGEVPVYPDMPATLEWTTSALVVDSGFQLVAYRIYRGRGSRFGLVGETTTGKFVDYGAEADYTQGPPEGRNPFKVYDYNGTLVRTEEPSTVAFFEERRVFGRSDERPGFLWFSRTGNYKNFDTNLPSVDDEAIDIEIASRRREEVRWLVNFGQRLVVGTNSSVWAVSGAGGSPLTYASVEAKVQSEVGTNWLDPIVASNSLLYARAKGAGIRDLFFSNERGAYAGNDLSAFAQHLFRGFQVVDWAWAEDPLGIVWVVRDDGALLSCTYSQEQGVFAWAAHDTDGDFEQVCTVPETTEDAVYVLVRRDYGGFTRRYIERLASRPVEPELEEALFLDASLTYEGAATNVVTGLSHLNGETVSALADGQVLKGLVVSGGSVTLGLQEGASTVHIGVPYESDVELLDLPEARTHAKTVGQVTVEVVASRGLWVGESEAELSEAKFRRVSDGYSAAALVTQEIEVGLRNSWNKGRGRVFLRQKDPLPLTVVGVTREEELGGK